MDQNEAFKSIKEFEDKLEQNNINELDVKKLNNIQCTKAYYYKSSFYYEKEDYIKAKQEIEFAIDLLGLPSDKPIKYGIVEYFLHNCDEKIIFRLAGKIYANLGEVEKSKDCYNKFQYYSIQLNSGFEDSDSAVLYSFRSVSVFSLSDLIQKAITVCNPSKMNDPFDSLFRLWADKDNQISISENNTGKGLEPFLNSFNYYKIRCFVGNKTLTSDNKIVKKILMWGQYADGHRGFCIKYRLSKAFIKKDKNANYSHLYLKRINYQPHLEKKKIRVNTMNTDELYALKSNEWKYENEVRLISYDPSCEEDHLQIQLDDKTAIEAIYFGYLCPENTIKTIRQILGEEVQYYKMDCDLENIYQLKNKHI